MLFADTDHVGGGSSIVSDQDKSTACECQPPNGLAADLFRKANSVLSRAIGDCCFRTATQATRSDKGFKGIPRHKQPQQSGEAPFRPYIDPRNQDVFPRVPGLNGKLRRMPSIPSSRRTGAVCDKLTFWSGDICRPVFVNAGIAIGLAQSIPAEFPGFGKTSRPNVVVTPVRAVCLSATFVLASTSPTGYGVGRYLSPCTLYQGSVPMRSSPAVSVYCLAGRHRVWLIRIYIGHGFKIQGLMQP
ncbi:hypothetical protein CCUS01_03516 [Colletotrichum cuscutae]|uniref:Uncharacterized protein n=1 Tax=Colletotrichum cuscutae TaxID=1209917 RepID=A0AAI9Y812_9PEZI|nr:hypothetical protein CCUS01_03516 [Colletotrichum cuscutae]